MSSTQIPPQDKHVAKATEQTHTFQLAFKLVELESNLIKETDDQPIQLFQKIQGSA